MSAGPRRLWALVRNLPPEAITWRGDRLPPVEEYLAELVERLDAWERANWLRQTARGRYRVTLPGPIEIERPGVVKRRGNIVTDPGELRRWFARNA